MTAAIIALALASAAQMNVDFSLEQKDYVNMALAQADITPLPSHEISRPSATKDSDGIAHSWVCKKITLKNPTVWNAKVLKLKLTVQMPVGETRPVQIMGEWVNLVDNVDVHWGNVHKKPGVPGIVIALVLRDSDPTKLDGRIYLGNWFRTAPVEESEFTVDDCPGTTQTVHIQ